MPGLFIFCKLFFSEDALYLGHECFANLSHFGFTIFARHFSIGKKRGHQRPHLCSGSIEFLLLAGVYSEFGKRIAATASAKTSAGPLVGFSIFAGFG